jgi:hypothetical protein
MERKHVTTKELAGMVGVQPATVRRGLCVDGEYLGLRPIKLKNRRLLWPLDGIRQILEGKS